MTDDDEHICAHPHPAECHNLERYACPNHFLEVLSRLTVGAASQDQDETRWALRDMAIHEWMSPALWTMCTLIQAFAGRPGESVEQTMARVRTHREPSPEDHPWVFRLGAITRAAILGDGDTIWATVNSIPGDPAMGQYEIGSLFASLALAAHEVVEWRPDVTPDTIAVYAILGSQAYTVQAYGLLPHIAALAEAIRTGTPAAGLTDRILSSTVDELTTAIGMCGRTMGQLFEPEGPEIFLTSTGHAPREGVYGVLDWRDEDRDPLRDRAEMCVTRAIRLAVAFAADDMDRVASLLNAHNGPELGPQYAWDIIHGSCTTLATMINGRDRAPH